MIASESDRPLSDEQIADALEEVAALLEAQGANPFRVQAYRSGAVSVRRSDRPVDDILKTEGIDGLMQMQGIGKSLAGAIEHLVHSGRLPLLDRLRGENAAERIFATVPDIGPGLASRIHQHLGIETLAELQAAANDGRLAKVPGMGQKRVRAVRESLAGRFARRFAPSPRPEQSSPADHDAATAASAEQWVSVEELLDIDEQYRRMARQGKLPRIAPRRFNPTGEAWLPILHTTREDRHYTALYSNTARAHQLGTTHDWVVIYRDDDAKDGQWTAITSQYGRLRGHRIIRGREQECQEYYERSKPRTLF